MSILSKFSHKKSEGLEKSEEVRVQETVQAEIVENVKKAENTAEVKVEDRTVTEEPDRKSQEQKKESNFKKGTDFENYALSLFPEKNFSMIQRAISFDPASGRRMEGCLNPDFKLRDKHLIFLSLITYGYSHPLKKTARTTGILKQQPHYSIQHVILRCIRQ